MTGTEQLPDPGLDTLGCYGNAFRHNSRHHRVSDLAIFIYSLCCTSKMAKKPWGTITHPKNRNPDFQMGYQKATGSQIDELVNRLYVPDYTNRNEKKQQAIVRKTKVEPKEPFESNDIEEIVERLTRKAEEKATDAKRIGSMKVQGVVNTYAWKGYN